MNILGVVVRMLGVMAASVLFACAGSADATASGQGPPAEAATKRPESPPDGGAPHDPDLTTGSFEFDASSTPELVVKRTSTGHLLVKPVINGKAGGWFIFDTGAGICVVSTPHVEQFGLAPAGSIDAVGVGGAASTSLYRATTLSLGPLTLRDHPVMTTDLSFLKQHLGEEIVGVLGYGVLMSCVAELDIAAPRIAIYDPAKYLLARGEWTPLELADRVPAVRARFEGHDGLFRLDTGANGHVTFHQPAVEKWRLLDGRDVRNAKMGGFGGFVAAKQGTVEWFELGGTRRENVPATFAIEAKGVFAETAKDGNIGAELLRPFVLVLDYAESRIAFLTHDDTVVNSAPAGTATGGAAPVP